MQSALHRVWNCLSAQLTLSLSLMSLSSPNAALQYLQLIMRQLTVTESLLYAEL